MRHLPSVLAALIAACLLAPATASAADIEVTLTGSDLTLTSDASNTSDNEEFLDVESVSFTTSFTIQVRSTNLDSFVEPSPVAECTISGPSDNVLSCDLTSNAVRVHLGPGADVFEVNAPGPYLAHVSVNGGDGNDQLEGGAGTDQLFGGAGQDALQGGDGPDELDGYVGAGNPAAGTDAEDVMSGNRGADTMYDTGNTPRDAADYSSDSFRTAGVTVSMDGQQNDGHPSFDDESAPGSMLGSDTVGGGIDDVLGTVDQGDTITGDSADNVLSGYGGNDALTGGSGHDVLNGNDGDDTLSARDDTADTDVSCGPGGADVATVDTSDTTVTECETVNRPSSNTNTNPGNNTGTTTTGTTTPTTTTTAPQATIGELTPKAGVEPYPQQAFKMVSFLRGTRACGGKRYCRPVEVKRYLQKRNLNFELATRDASRAALERRVEAGRIDAGEVIAQDPDRGDDVVSGPTEAFRMRLQVFNPDTLSKCNLAKPFVRVGRTLFRMTDLLKDVSLRTAEERLADYGCSREKYTLVDKVVRGASDNVVHKARITGSGKRRRVQLTVHHGAPELQFAFPKPRLVSGYLPPVWGDNNEIVLPQDESFTLYVNPTKAGVGVSNLYVQLRNSKGDLEELGRTNASGVADISGGIDKAGRYELFASLCDKEEDCVVGWKRIDVARLDPRRTYLGIDGLTYGRSDGRWKPVATSAKARAAQAPDRASIGALASDIVTRVALSPLFYQASIRDPTGPLYQAVLKLNAAGSAAVGKGNAGYFDALVARGIEFTILAGGGSTPTTISKVDFVRKTAIYSDGTRTVSVPITAIDTNNGAVALKVDNFMFLPGGLFYLVTGGGTTAGPVQRVQQVSATAPNLDLVNLKGATAIGLAGGGAAPLIGADGGTLIGNDAGSLIGMDGGTLIGMDGATLIGMDGASLIGADGASLIGADGGSLIGADGASIISRDGAGLFPR